MSYRIAAKEKPIFSQMTWWETNKYVLADMAEDLAKAVAILFISVIFLVIMAASLQWVVAGIAGRPMGTFYHYLVGIIIFNVLRMKTKKKET